MTTYESLRTRPWHLIFMHAGEWKLLSATGDVLGFGPGGMSEETRLAWVAIGWAWDKRPKHAAVGVWSWPLNEDEMSIIEDRIARDEVDEWARSRARAEDTP